MFRLRRPLAITDISAEHTLAATFIFGLCTLTRSNGILLFIIIGQVCVTNIIAKRREFFTVFKYTLTLLIGVLVAISPVVLVTSVSPYQMHCADKPNPSFMGEWCFQDLPNLYTHVQEVYWNAGFLQFLNRPGWPGETAKALPTLLVLGFVLLKTIRSQGLLHFLTLGVFKSHQLDDEYDVTSHPLSISLTWHFFLTAATILTSANHEVLTRLVSASPMFLYGAVEMLMSQNQGIVQRLAGIAFSVMQLVTLLFNLSLFPLHVGFL